MKKWLIILGILLSTAIVNAEIKEAYLAGGCFWCVESDLEKLSGVKSVISGYSGGTIKSPTYEEVSAGGTGHRESVLVKYEDSEISYANIINYFLKHIDPTDGDGEFIDRGFQYSPAIFYLNENQKKDALKELSLIKEAGNFKEMKVALIPFKNFYSAEEYHQNYYKKNPIRYKYYRYRSGRDQFLEKIWAK
ncbi:peptide-methionine (S)-S-oxide reductase MsrA [uncultured Cetobacterium sp.]|uniref:peptide-methionine (S)-S-oxide reductase MsrA n=1 Tax=uncultured Cetobacterium sp. TaxID=527638 RepID=UPI002612745C|nr:peptide-methionine (S)-S-oxide reductase MsrA [uncultured Cetobacterium sp.]